MGRQCGSRPSNPVLHKSGLSTSVHCPYHQLRRNATKHERGKSQAPSWRVRGDEGAWVRQISINFVQCVNLHFDIGSLLTDQPSSTFSRRSFRLPHSHRHSRPPLQHLQPPSDRSMVRIRALASALPSVVDDRRRTRVYISYWSEL